MFTCYSRYSKGVSAVETILLVDRLRQQVPCQNHHLFHVYDLCPRGPLTVPSMFLPSFVTCAKNLNQMQIHYKSL